MALKTQLVKISKENKSITKYMHLIKSIADEIAILDTPIGDEELTLLIIDVVGDDYKELAAAIRARDNPISFEELHDKLGNFEAFLEWGGNQSITPITANATTKSNNNGGWKNNNQNCRKPNNNGAGNQYSGSNQYGGGNQFRQGSNSNFHSNNRNPNAKPYKGFCQLCEQQSQTAKRCPSFQSVS